MVIVRIAVYVVYIQSILCSRTILCSRITCGRGILCSRAGVADGAMLAVSEYEVSVGPGPDVRCPASWCHGCLTPLVSFNVSGLFLFVCF